MKPNDKAVETALGAATHIPGENMRQYMRRVLTAAFAAQFPPSENYAGLVKWLRDKAESLSEIYPPEAEAADALEALLAERDALKAELAAANTRMSKLDFERTAAELERDALLARLAPVDDEALETIAARAIVKENVYKETQIPSKTLARAAIAAIRPHIEAAERERIANQTENWSRNPAFQLLATAIRSGK